MPIIKSTSTTSTITTTSTISKPTVIMSAHLSLRNDYDKLINYMQLLSQISGDMNDSITAAYNSISSDTNSADYTTVISALDTNLYTKHNALKVSVSTTAALSDVVNSSCNDFSSAISTASKELSAVPAATKNDCLNSLTPEVASSVALKNKFEYGIREPLEESLTIYDVSAASWFYNYNKDSLSSLKQCIIFGLPSGFTSLLARQDVKVEYNTDGTIKDTTLTQSPVLPQRRDTTKMTANVSARSLLYPHYDIKDLSIGSFHPYVHAYVNSSIEKSSTLLGLAGEGLTVPGSVKLMCYDKLSGTWIDSLFSECIAFLQNGGSFGVSSYSGNAPTIASDVAESIISFHTMDAILKSTIRSTCGLEFRENTLSSSERTIAPASAASLIDLLGGSGTTPRGGLTASQFLNLNSDGNYIAIPYSGLSGEASNSTDPSTHGLLLKILNSGVFTSETSLQRILSPDPFERIYCAMYDPNTLKYDVSRTGVLNDSISLASLLSIGITAE